MLETWREIQIVITALGGVVGGFLGGIDGFMYTLIVFVIVDYITGFMCAVIERSLDSEVGFRGIFKKIVIFLLVGMANLIDINVIQTGAILRTAVIFFYLSNEGVSILENAGRLGLPIPNKLRAVLAQLRDDAEKDPDVDLMEDEDDDA